MQISKRTIQNHEANKNQPNQSILEQYARLYQMSWKWLQTGIESYQQDPEHVLPQKKYEAPDSGPGQQRLPSDLRPYRVVKVLASEEGHRRELHAKLDQILNSGDESLILAITCNVEELEQALRDRIELAKQKKPPKIYSSTE